MEVAINGDQAVPMIISYRVVKRAPQVESRRKFVGILQGLKSLVVKGIELAEEIFWEEERKVGDLGESTVVHYAIDICHETDGVNTFPATLRVTQLPGNSRPACGAHFEVIKVAEERKTINDEVIRVPRERLKAEEEEEEEVEDFNELEPIEDTKLSKVFEKKIDPEEEDSVESDEQETLPPPIFDGKSRSPMIGERPKANPLRPGLPFNRNKLRRDDQDNV
jgi:hypothetical protein